MLNYGVASMLLSSVTTIFNIDSNVIYCLTYKIGDLTNIFSYHLFAFFQYITALN